MLSPRYFLSENYIKHNLGRQNQLTFYEVLAHASEDTIAWVQSPRKVSNNISGCLKQNNNNRDIQEQ
jgi:hypothetical protein